MKILFKQFENAKKRLNESTAVLNRQNYQCKIDKWQCIANVCTFMEELVENNFSDIQNVSICIKPEDDAWYCPNHTILVDIDRFNNLNEDLQKFTIAHEVAHHIISNGINDYFRSKYQIEFSSDEEVIADFIVKYEFKLPLVGRAIGRISAVDNLCTDRTS